MKSKIFSIIGTLLFGFIYFYVALPALNIQTYEFWFFITLLILCFLVLTNITSTKELITGKTTLARAVKKNKAILIIPAIYILFLVFNFFGSPVFNAKKYAHRIEINDSASFTEDTTTFAFFGINPSFLKKLLPFESSDTIIITPCCKKTYLKSLL